MRKIYLLVFLFLCINISFAAAENDLITKANRFYQAGNFDKAVELYRQVVSSGYESPVLYYNLGNSYYRLGKIGYAILNYERAAKLSPGDEDITHNLALANSRIVDKIDIVPPFFLVRWWEHLLASFSISGWTYTAYFFYILILLSIGLFFFTKSPFRQKLSLYSAAAFIIILIFISSLLSIRLSRELNFKNGVVIEQAVNAKLSPDDKSPDAFVLHEGLKVRLEDKVNDWVRIRLGDGKVGWLPEKVLQTI
jgi:tetratricopeptide (TPR) repeat protein